LVYIGSASADVDQAVNVFSQLQQVDPYRLDNMDTYSNLLYVKVCDNIGHLF